MEKKSAYSMAGVDYSLIDPFKRLMVETGKKTLNFPNRRDVFLNEDLMHSHGAVFEYNGQCKHMWCQTQEGLGNKNWIAEWVYANDGTGRSYYDLIAQDAALMIVNDLIAQGAMPVVYTDEVAAGNSEWFEDVVRATDLARGIYNICEKVGMALGAGESPSLKYLIRAANPVKSAPSLSGCITGIIAPKDRLITGKNLQVGDAILGVESSGIHANGISLLIKKTMQLSSQFLTKLPNGNSLGDEALIPTMSYVDLVEALWKADVDVHAFLPGTGGGIAKIAYDKRPFTYRIHTWTKNIPQLFLFMQELGVSLIDCLETFNWGIGYYMFVPKKEVANVIEIGNVHNYKLYELGQVQEGERKVVFEPEGITLPPPGQ